LPVASCILLAIATACNWQAFNPNLIIGLSRNNNPFLNHNRLVTTNKISTLIN